MRKVFSAILVIAAIAGCTSHKAAEGSGTTGTASGPGGSQTQTVQTNGGSISIGQGAVDPMKIGLPVYPGAAANVNGALSGTSASGSSALVTLRTSDSFDKVYGWYKSHLPVNVQATRSTSGATLVGTFLENSLNGKGWKSVTLTSLPVGTAITLRSATRN
jgi:hypothetical protein